jgi:hypothetical protein
LEPLESGSAITVQDVVEDMEEAKEVVAELLKTLAELISVPSLEL